MSRPLRIQYPNAWYHVMNRGRRKESVFLDDGDYLTFTELLRECTSLWKVRISAYCLLPNHYHILLQTPLANLSRCMRHIDGVYTQRINQRRRIDGQLFRGRYKAILVDADSYLLEVLRYIHRNPLKAGLVERLDQYPWSSHKGYLSRFEKWNWLHKDFILGMLARKRADRARAYRRFVSDRDSGEIEKFYSMKNMRSILGSVNFVDWVKERFSEITKHDEVPEWRILLPEIEEILWVVSTDYDLEPEDLYVLRRGVHNEPRDVAMYLIRHLRTETLVSIADRFGLKRHSGVRTAIIRMQKRMKANRRLRARVKRLVKQIKVSQQSI